MKSSHRFKRGNLTSAAFQKRCMEAGVELSMGSVGDCYDNAMCESFFATLECELIEQVPFDDVPHAIREVFRFIEGWYNSRRLHSSLGYRSPMQFEQLGYALPLLDAAE